jgi:polysaccharide transporter, PST family
VLKNIFSLYVLQFLSYFSPLFITPYLARVLGVEMFGLLGVCGSIVAYLSLVANWGFDLSATQQVARSADNPEALRTIFWNVVVAKCGLGIVCVAALCLAVLVSSTLRAYGWVLVASSIALAGNVIGVGFFLQGVERMGIFAAASIAGRLGAVPLTFLFVHSPRDAAIAAMIQGVALLASSVASLVLAARVAPLWPVRFSLSGVLGQLRDGATLFVSTGAVSLYTYANVVMVGLLGGAGQAGLFDGADRLRRAGQSLTGPISAAMYPRINSMLVNSRHEVSRTMVRLFLVQGSLSLVLSVGLFITAPFATLLFLGRDYSAAIPVEQCLSINIFLIGVSNVLGINVMLPLGMSRPYTFILLLSGVLNIILLLVLVARHGALGAAESVTITEACVTLSMGFWLWLQRRRGRLAVPAEE